MKLIAYGKTNWGKDFPSTLEDQAFYYALKSLKLLKKSFQMETSTL